MSDLSFNSSGRAEAEVSGADSETLMQLLAPSDTDTSRAPEQPSSPRAPYPQSEEASSVAPAEEAREAPSPAPVPAPVFQPSCPDRRPVARFEGALDGLLSQFRAQARVEWAESEADLRRQYEAEALAEKLHTEAQLGEATARVAATAAENAGLNTALATKRTQLKQSLHLASRIRRDLRHRQTLDIVVRRWRIAVSLAHDKQVTSGLARRLRARRLFTRSFGHWRHRATREVYERQLAAMRAEWQTERTQMIGLAEMQRQKDVDEMGRLREQFAQEQKSKEQLQEDLKKVFMRGVCTLNFEAMQLLNSERIDQVGLAPVAASLPRSSSPPRSASPVRTEEQDLRASVASAASEIRAAAAEMRTVPAAELQAVPAEAPADPEPVACAETPEKTSAPRVVDASKLVKFSAAPPVPCMTVIRPRR